MSIEARGVRKRFGAFEALRGVSLEIATGELIALLGPSGSGKTTLLRVIAGLESADHGAVLFDGADAADLSLRDRRVGFVFQHYALFKHLTVYENVAFGLRVRPKQTRPSDREITRRVDALLALVQLGGLARRYPDQLSGGQRQRVALARALAVEPRVLLLDEPFGALDARVRQELRRWLRALHAQLGITSVFVTHDRDEALELADRIVVLNEGRVEQVGTPEQVYANPASPFVCAFLGDVNRLSGQLDRGRIRIGPAEFDAAEHRDVRSTPAVAYARPEEIEVTRHPAGAAIPALVRQVRVLGPTVRLDLSRRDTGDPLEARLTRDAYRALAPQPGETVALELRNLRVYLED